MRGYALRAQYPWRNETMNCARRVEQKSDTKAGIERKREQKEHNHSTMGCILAGAVHATYSLLRLKLPRLLRIEKVKFNFTGFVLCLERRRVRRYTRGDVMETLAKVEYYSYLANDLNVFYGCFVPAIVGY